MVKQFLKKIPLVSALNSIVKKHWTTRQSRRLADYYAGLIAQKKAGYDEERIIADLRERTRTRLKGFRAGEKARVVWAGAYYEQDYSGFLQGLQRRAHVFPVSNSLGRYGWEYSPRLYDEALIERNSKCVYETWKQARQEGPVHFLMGQMWAHLVSVEVLGRIRSAGTVVMNVAWDDRLPEHWQRRGTRRMGAIGLAEECDVVLQSCPDLCARYLAEGHLAWYWPMASDPEIFRQRPELPKINDVCFVGSKYGIRADIIRALDRSKVTVAAYGPGWPNAAVTTEQTAQIFAQSKIILGVGTVAHNDDILTLKLRDFDAPMTGSLYITHHNPDLDGLYRIGSEIECYSSIPECVRKIRHYLGNEGEREAIARAGRLRAMKDHTWNKRFETLFGAFTQKSIL